MNLNIPGAATTITVVPSAVPSHNDFYDITVKSWNHSSPSQIKTFRRCNLRWWFNKIAGIEERGSGATDLGTRGHTIAENYLKGVPLPDDPAAMKVMAPGLARLPTPIPAALVEVAMTLQTEVAPIIGRIDFVWHFPTVEWGCNDHKTIKNLKYKLEETELRMDAQAVVYSKALLEETGDKAVGFRHLYYQTSSPGIAETSIVMTRGEVDDRWGTVLYTVTDQKKLSAVNDARHVPGNDKACKDFGKTCDYAAFCPVKKQAGTLSFGGPKKADAMGLLDVLREDAKKQAQEKLIAAGHPRDLVMAMPAITVQALVHQLTDPVNPPDKTADALPEEEEDVAEETEQQPTPAPEKQEPGKLHWKAARQQLAELMGVTFKELSDRVKAAGWKPEDIQAEILRMRAGKPSAMKTAAVKEELPAGYATNGLFQAAETMPMPMPTGAPAVVVPAAVVAKVLVPTAGKPLMSLDTTITGREGKAHLDIYRETDGIRVVVDGAAATMFPSGTTIAAAVAQVREGVAVAKPTAVPVAAAPSPTVTVAAPNPEPAPVPATQHRLPFSGQTVSVTPPPVVAPTPAPAPITIVPIILYLDCAPSWEHTRLEDLVLPLQAEVENEKRAFYFGVLPFNEGPKLVAALLAKKINSGELILPEHLVIRTFQTCGWPCYDILCRYAKGVVRKDG